MTVKEIDYHVKKGSNRESDTCSNQPKRVVAPPDKQSEEDIVADLHHQIGDAVPLGQYTIAHRQRHTTQESVEDRYGGHSRHHQKLIFIKQLQDIWHEQDKQNEEGRNQKRTNIYLLIDGVVRAQLVVVDGRKPWK